MKCSTKKIWKIVDRFVCDIIIIIRSIQTIATGVFVVYGRMSE